MKNKSTSMNLLKVIAVILILVQHTVSSFVTDPVIKALTLSVTFNGVAVLAMVTGYFVINSKNYGARWIYLVIYGLPLLVAHMVIGMNYNLFTQNLDGKTLTYELLKSSLNSLFQVSWYYFSIIIVMAIAPFLSYFNNNVKNGRVWTLTLLIVMLVILVPLTIIKGFMNAFSTEDINWWSVFFNFDYMTYFKDMSFVPLLIWFLVGATVKQFNMFQGFWKRISGKNILVLIILILILFMFLGEYAYDGRKNFSDVMGKIGTIYYFSFRHIMITITSMCMVGLFANISFDSKIIDRIALHIFFFYLMHYTQIDFIKNYLDTTSLNRAIISISIIPIGIVLWFSLGELYYRLMNSVSRNIELKVNKKFFTIQERND